MLYLALRNIAKKWTMPVHPWKAALNRFAIIYENRLPVDVAAKRIAEMKQQRKNPGYGNRGKTNCVSTVPTAPHC